MMNYAVRLVLALARSQLYVREQGGENRGQVVEEYLRTTGLDEGYPWCAAFIAWCGKQAHGAAWPLPLTAGCKELGAAAEAKGLLVEKPQAGDVFLLLYEKLGRFAHTGFVTDVLPDGRIRTIEGNTNDGGSRDGYGVFARIRAIEPGDRFIRWWSSRHLAGEHP
jgi:hypothetical protein